MELKVFKDTIASYGGRWETRLELPVETEILIPDYLPAVFKIVKCLITPVVLQNRVAGGRWQVEGYLRCTVFYQSEEPGTRLLRTEQKFAFEKSVELPAGQYAEGPARSGANRNTVTAAPSASTASTCAGRTSSAPQWPCGGSPNC
ncbi:DUF3794 domain-containing protein [Gemmiger formicilis]|uniref:DUF3794 domain-containing protein n=1 Tax=Gemmiger formicilis TaxID=745368 RepID=UPI003996291D